MNSAIQKYIPRVVEAASNALLLEPEGDPLTKPTSTHWNQLLLVLKELHASGHVHRDIRPDNILVQPETRDVLLIDFGFSVETAKSVPYCGTVPQIPSLMHFHNINLARYSARLLTIWFLLCAVLLPCTSLENIATHEWQRVKQLWDETLEKLSLWKECLQAAEQTQHDVLAKLFSQTVF